MTRLALVNAIYFKGNWMNRFDEKTTKEMPFKINQVNKRQNVDHELSISPWWLLVVQVKSKRKKNHLSFKVQKSNLIIAKSTLFIIIHHVIL